MTCIPPGQRPFFVFQKQRYEWDPEAKEFKKVAAPVSNSISFYMKSKPYASRKTVCTHNSPRVSFAACVWT